MKDYVIFRLKTLWPFDPENSPHNLDQCAKCHHAFWYHRPNCNLCSCSEFMVNLHDQIKNGVKTSEWRDATPYWVHLLTDLPSSFYLPSGTNMDAGVDLTQHLRVKKAWMTFGYPKGSLPRFEIELTHLTLFPATKQFKIDFVNVKEKME